jgi:hypothetical protein
MPFLINLHITMFYALLIAGTICAFWGLGLFIARYQAMKKVALEVESSKEPKDQEPRDNAGSAPTAADTPARPRPPLISPLFRSALKVTAYLALLQAVIGGLIYFFLPAYRPADQLHYVYGILVLLAIPVAFIYMSGKPEHLRRDMLILILAALVVAAAAVRAALTGGLF